MQYLAFLTALLLPTLTAAQNGTFFANTTTTASASITTPLPSFILLNTTTARSRNTTTIRSFQIFTSEVVTPTVTSIVVVGATSSSSAPTATGAGATATGASELVDDGNGAGGLKRVLRATEQWDKYIKTFLKGTEALQHRVVQTLGAGIDRVGISNDWCID